MADPPDIRVLIVDDQVLMRRGLSRLLELEPGITVVGEACDGREALHHLDTAGPHRQPDVLLVDAHMPTMNGVELARAMTAQHRPQSLIMLSTFDDDDFVLGSLGSGARAYLLKDTPPEVLAQAIRTVDAGGTVLDDAVSSHVITHLHHDTGAPERALSDREQQVAELVGNGASNREIALALHITEGTAKNHLSSILRKLDLRDRVHLALWVREQGSGGSAAREQHPRGGPAPPRRR